MTYSITNCPQHPYTPAYGQPIQPRTILDKKQATLERKFAYIGETEEHLNAYFALGYGGNGITYNVVAADIIFDLCLGRDNPDATFRFGR